MNQPANTQTIELTAADGHSLSAHVRMPATPTHAGVVVVQEIFGVNGHVRSLVQDFAASGYLTIAPALFDRVRRGVELDYSAGSITEGLSLAGQVMGAPALRDVSAAVDWLRSRGAQRVGVVGYCFGGTIAWLAAAGVDVDAAVCYYGGGIAAHLDKAPRCPVIMHFGDRDHRIPLSDVEKIKAALPAATVHVYPAGHGFNCNQRADFDAAAAQLARERTLAFLHQHLRASAEGSGSERGARQ